MVGRRFRGVILAGLAAAFGCAEERDDSALAGPYPETVSNVLFICIDTVRADVFHGLGELEDGPMADWRKRALDFTRVMSTSPWTVPSIGSVFTGLWPYSHGAGRFPHTIAEMSTQAPVRAYEDVTFLTQAAQKRGFNTAVFSASAWTYNPFLSMGLLRGFDEVVKYETNWRPMVAEMSRSFGGQPPGGRNYYFLHLMEAHDWHPKEEAEIDAHLEQLTPQERILISRVAPIAACEADETSLLCRRYLVYVAAVRELRVAIAATLEKLRDIGALEDTVVILFSDHGEEFSDHADAARVPARLEGYSDSYPRDYGHGHKMFEELLHVPLMIWHPAYEGAEIDQPVSLVDIAPTVARWLGIDFSPDAWPGYYLESTMAPLPEVADRVLFASSISYGEEQVSIRRGDRKSIWYAASDASDFFDLERDPGERHPLSAPPWALQFDGHLLDYVDSKPGLPSRPSELTDEQIRQLQSIGYMQGVDVGRSDSKRQGGQSRE